MVFRKSNNSSEQPTTRRTALAVLESASEFPKIFAVKRVVKENSLVKTLVFEGALDAKPGQFVLLWFPKVDAKPFGISMLEKKEFGVSVACVGEFTEKICLEARKGMRLGVFGPYGNGFTLEGGKDKRICCIAGGYGAAPLFFLATQARKKGLRVTFIEGARSKDKLVFLKPLHEMGVDLRIATDDGSAGFKGFSTQVFENALASGEEFDCVYACGPEKMAQRVLALCLRKKIPAQFSLDRFIKCGFGLCGQCAIDGALVCKDGPVFDAQQLAGFKEFGRVRRDASGAKIRI